MSETQDGVLWVVEIQDFHGKWVLPSEDILCSDGPERAKEWCADFERIEVPARVVKYARVSE